jgi:3-oxoacyl-[acyl-carrier-protein] synthase II
MASSRRVVITGIGVVTPLGLDVSSYWEGLRQGRSGVSRVQSFDTSALPPGF